MKKIIIYIVIIAIIVGGVVWFMNRNTTTPVNIKSLKIGAALPLTGVLASFGDEFRRGAEVAQDELNQNGKMVEVIFEDTQLDPKKAVDAVSKMVLIDKVDAIFVSAFNEAAATHHITDQKGIPELVLWDSNPQLEAMGDKVFALGPWTPASGEVTAEFIYNKGAKKAAIFGYNQEWSTGVSEAFSTKFKQLGGTITDSEFTNPGATDYRTQISKIIATNPDTVYLTVEDFLKGVKQFKDLGFKGSIITSDLLDNDQINQNPGLFEGVYGSQVADPASDETSHFLALYKKKYGEDSKKIVYGAWGYDAVQLYYKGYTNVQSKSLVDAMYSVDYKGASGNIKFDVNGTSKTIPKMFVVKNSVITLVK